ncbi:hypothetical protein HNR23_000463 [Nocardiopsis mwathae]|uniref:DUF695 domain-containing protein n=1 Tax=Nocardiopsis mwathae TaxID=1472723 RepID=A0A7X0D3P5_9ACTN|nr:DUF695 domain-containing protein [Nocardiopsis mwathae]MBB6170403.1 hypothetical protein [Nocardiopsis mwathae]
MALFRRRKSESPDSAVAVDGFWSRWADVRGPLAVSVDAGSPVSPEIADRITERVTRIHPALTWRASPAPSTGPGGIDDLGGLGLPADADPDELLARLAEADAAAEGPAPSYALTLIAGADDEARVLAERWMRAAPADADWRFFPAIPADHAGLGETYTTDDHRLDLSHCSVSLRVDQQRNMMEAGVYHPDNMFLPEEAQQGLAEHVVMLALGEDDCVRWISRVTPLSEKPLDPLPPTSMPAVVQQLAGAFGGGWVTVQARIRLTGIVEIAVRHPLHRRDFPAMTLSVTVALPYTDSDADKLPAEPSASALEAFTARLDDLLGDNGALLARQTMGGQRILHYYLDPESGVLPEFESAVQEWPEGRAMVRSRLEPNWDTVNQLIKPIKRQLGQ